MTRKKAFTLIELLVVIAIIGILAAIIFPVFMKMKEQAFKSSDLSNMNQIRTALQLYRADQGAYPPALLGYATGYSNFAPSTADIVPANVVVGALYPKRVDSIETLRPWLDTAAAGSLYNSFTTAQWPRRSSTVDPDANRNQKYGPGEGPNGVVSRCVDPSISTSPYPNYYYNVSGYDAAPVRDGATRRTELHYTLFWTGYTVSSQCSPSDATGSANDDPRQLGYAEPPETTVVTWDSFFRDYDASNQPTNAKKDVVLFLGGGAKPASSRDVFNRSFSFMP